METFKPEPLAKSAFAVAGRGLAGTDGRLAGFPQDISRPSFMCLLGRFHCCGVVACSLLSWDFFEMVRKAS